jgi:hypothetical protein
LSKLAEPVAVFVNCPFDPDYRPLFDIMIFTIVRCGFVARCALEVTDTAETRISKILRLIDDCPIGIHDISRTEPDKGSGLPRFNMPFELGLFLGIGHAAKGGKRRKVCLVLDRAPYRYQIFLSDISGQDVSAHSDDPARLCEKVRNFLNAQKGGPPLPSGAAIMTDYADFRYQLPAIASHLRLDPDDLQFPDYHTIAADFISDDIPPQPTSS